MLCALSLHCCVLAELSNNHTPQFLPEEGIHSEIPLHHTTTASIGRGCGTAPFTSLGVQCQAVLPANHDMPYYYFFMPAQLCHCDNLYWAIRQPLPGFDNASRVS